MESSAMEGAKEWLEIDFHAPTRSVVQSLVDKGDTASLVKMFAPRIAFGTAGLRGPMGAGYSNMNHITVMQCTQGIVKYLEQTLGTEEVKTRGVVIGYDHRWSATGVDSEMMARTAAAVCVMRGVKVFLFSGMVATPLVPFCVKYKKCAAGMMVTASHNPKDDNGYKMYGANGAQLCEPHDKSIAALILDNLKPWGDYASAIESVRDSPLCVDILEEAKDAYFEEMAASLCHHADDNADSSLPIVYTAMHGVGAPYTARSFQAFKLKPFFSVAEQNDPDPSFPTVAYPNPEEGKGALELSFSKASSVKSPLVLANDPDADRLAVAELQEGGKWKIFSGNEIGMLLAHWLYRKAVEKGKSPSKLAIVASTVSSKMTRALALKEGMRFEETLTGFKWICNKKFDLQQEGYEVILAFEESIGFCCGDLVNDKDGVCAAAVFAEMSVQLYKAGMTVSKHLDFLYESYGHFISRQGYVLVPNPKLTVEIFDKIRNDRHYPTSVGPYKISQVRDLTTGYDSSTADNKTTLPASASSQVSLGLWTSPVTCVQHLTFTFDNGCIANLRGSGTEPKLKYYVELHGSNAAQ
eukprot:764375-Hanusia_phi.AAC.3